MPSLTRLARHAAIIRSHSAAFIAIGFSQSTCFPAFAAAIVWSACRCTGVATYTLWTSGSPRRSRHRGYQRLAPSPVASSARSARARLIATNSHAGDPRKAGATRLLTMSPAPITPHLNALKPDFERELDLAFSGPARGTRGAGQHRRDRSERRVAKLTVRIRELRVVQQIEHLHPQLRRNVRDLRQLDERRIDVELSRPPHCVAAGGAECAGGIGHLLEALSVEPLSNRWVAERRVADLVRPVVRDAGRQHVLRLRNRDRQAGPEIQETAHLPAAPSP